MKRIIPNIPKIKARWYRRKSDIPDWLDVPMSDGRVIPYFPNIPQPAFAESIRIIQKMTDPEVGYERK